MKCWLSFALSATKGFVAAYGTWNFGEALTLSQYSDPDAPAVPQSKPGSKGRRGHQTRLFACAALLEARLSGLIRDSAPCLDSPWLNVSSPRERAGRGDERGCRLFPDVAAFSAGKRLRGIGAYRWATHPGNPPAFRTVL